MSPPIFRCVKQAMKRTWNTIRVKRNEIIGSIPPAFSGGFHDAEVSSFLLHGPFRCRIAVYEEPLSAPRIIVIEDDEPRRFMAEMCDRAFTIAKSMGTVLPRTVFKELLDNLIHAAFQEAIVSITDRGNGLIVSDRGKGIPSAEKAMEPGFSTATEFLRSYIRGVGAGLPLVKEIVEKMGGSLILDRNIDRGCRIRISLDSARLEKLEGEHFPAQRSFSFSSQGKHSDSLVEPVELTDREKHVLLLLGEIETAGPSKVARELDISLSTAHRELARLERRSLVQSLPNGKKRLTGKGIGQLELIFSSSQGPK